MTYLSIALIVVWLAAVLFFCGRYLNDLRLVMNNLTPEAGYSDFMKPARFWRYHFRFSGVDPERLTETGRAHLKRAINTERIIFALMISGFALFASVSSYLRA